MFVSIVSIITTSLLLALFVWYKKQRCISKSSAGTQCTSRITGNTPGDILRSLGKGTRLEMLRQWSDESDEDFVRRASIGTSFDIRIQPSAVSSEDPSEVSVSELSYELVEHRALGLRMGMCELLFHKGDVWTRHEFTLVIAGDNVSFTPKRPDFFAKELRKML